MMGGFLRGNGVFGEKKGPQATKGFRTQELGGKRDIEGESSRDFQAPNV